MKKRDVEKKIYECLGVNLFRKYILFNYEKIWKLFPGKNKDKIGYRLDNFNVESIKKYKKQAKGFLITHIFAVPICMILNPINLFNILINIFLNGYCIMVQRYNIIRIDETVEKYERLMEKRNNKNGYNDNNDIKNEVSKNKVKEYCSKKEELIELKNELLAYKFISEQENYNVVSKDENVKKIILKKEKNVIYVNFNKKR